MELKCEEERIVNKWKLRFCKYFLHDNKSTYSNMVCGKLDETPRLIAIKCKMVIDLANKGK